MPSNGLTELYEHVERMSGVILQLTTSLENVVALVRHINTRLEKLEAMHEGDGK
jgi:hypothetical protein